jgi:hypothetical protein
MVVLQAFDPLKKAMVLGVMSQSDSSVESL